MSSISQHARWRCVPPRWTAAGFRPARKGPGRLGPGRSQGSEAPAAGISAQVSLPRLRGPADRGERLRSPASRGPDHRPGNGAGTGHVDGERREYSRCHGAAMAACWPSATGTAGSSSGTWSAGVWPRCSRGAGRRDRSVSSPRQATCSQRRAGTDDAALGRRHGGVAGQRTAASWTSAVSRPTAAGWRSTTRLPSRHLGSRPRRGIDHPEPWPDRQPDGNDRPRQRSIAARFSPDGRLVAVATGEAVYLYDGTHRR